MKGWWNGSPPRATDVEIIEAVTAGRVVPVYLYPRDAPRDNQGHPLRPMLRLVSTKYVPLKVTYLWARVDIETWLKKRTELGLIVVRHPNPEKARSIFHVGWNPALRPIVAR